MLPMQCRQSYSRRSVRLATSLVQYKQFHCSGLVGGRQQAVHRTFSPPGPEERLKHLKSGEKTVAVIAGVSLLVGYFALKRSFSDISSKVASVRAKMEALQVEKLVLVVAGPSGSGKSTLINRLFKQYPDKYAFSISHTTRSPRGSEKNGVEYHFVTTEEMKKAIENGEFLEWAEFSGNFYGTSVKSVLDCQKKGKVCILDIDMQGVQSIKKTELKALYLHIKPPSLQVLEERLRARKTDSEDAVRKRLDMAKKELDYAATPGVFDHVVVNDNVDEAFRELEGIINKRTEIKPTS